MKHIMVAVDGSDASYRALEHAAELAKGLEAELSILIVRLVVVGRQNVFVEPGTDEVGDIQGQVEKITLAAGVPKPSILVERSRDVAYKIVDVAIDKKADLIVMGASGKGGFKAFLLGSISQEVLEKSACPVTIVH